MREFLQNRSLVCILRVSSRQIKVNQPRRYLVRPSHGLLAPGSSVSIMITIVKKEQGLILETHELLGSAMPPSWSIHKFLIQSCAIPQEHLPRTFHDSGMDDLIDWKRVWNGDFSSVSYHTLDVEHVVVDKKKPSSRRMVKDMTSNEIASELEGLRGKFDKLKDMHIALLVERDLLHNKLAAAKPLPIVASPAPPTNKQENGTVEKSSASTREVL